MQIWTLLAFENQDICQTFWLISYLLSNMVTQRYVLKYIPLADKMLIQYIINVNIIIISTSSGNICSSIHLLKVHTGCSLDKCSNQK